MSSLIPIWMLMPQNRNAVQILCFSKIFALIFSIFFTCLSIIFLIRKCPWAWFFPDALSLFGNKHSSLHSSMELLSHRSLEPSPDYLPHTKELILSLLSHLFRIMLVFQSTSYWYNNFNWSFFRTHHQFTHPPVKSCFLGFVPGHNFLLHSSSPVNTAQTAHPPVKSPSPPFRKMHFFQSLILGEMFSFYPILALFVFMLIHIFHCIHIFFIILIYLNLLATYNPVKK